MLEKIDAHSLSYIIGFIQGDGHHGETTRNRGKVEIELSLKDIDILDKIESCLNPFFSVNRRNRLRSTNFILDHESVSLTIHDLAFRTAIKPFVPIGRKSDIIEPPFALLGFSKRDYIRGLIDADGAVGVRTDGKPFISLCISSEKIKEFFIDSIFEVTGLRKEMKRNSRDNVYNIMLNNEEAILYADYLYKDSSLYLDRKYLKYNEMLLWQRNNKKRTWTSTKWTQEEDNIVLDLNITLEKKIEILGRTDRSIGMRWYRLNGKNY